MVINVNTHMNRQEIRFFKDCFPDAELLALAALDGTFKPSDSPVIDFAERNRNRDQWYDTSGSYDVWADSKAKESGRKEDGKYIRLYPYMKMNGSMEDFYASMVAKFKVVECPYCLVSNETEMKAAFSLIGSGVHRLHEFPFIVGREPGFTFQSKASDSIADYILFERRQIYRYVQKEIPASVGEYTVQQLR